MDRGYRPVLFHASRNHWMRITFVSDHLAVSDIIRCILPHAKHKHFVKVLVNGNSVVPSSIPPGFGNMVIDFLTIPCNGRILGPDGESMQYSFDVTTTAADLVIFIAGKTLIHVKALKVYHDKQPVKLESFLSVLPMTQLSWCCHCDLSLQLLTLPQFIRLKSKCISHHRIQISVPQCLVHFCVWPFVIQCGGPSKLWDVIAIARLAQFDLLFPDLSNSYIKAFLKDYCIPLHATFVSLGAIEALDISFENTRPLPVTRLEIIPGTDIIEQVGLGKLGRIDRHGCNEPVRWIKSPFEARASERQFPHQISLTRVAGLFLAHCAASQVILSLVHGKHMVTPAWTLGI